MNQNEIIIVGLIIALIVYSIKMSKSDKPLLEQPVDQNLESAPVQQQQQPMDQQPSNNLESAPVQQTNMNMDQQQPMNQSSSTDLNMDQQPPSAPVQQQQPMNQSTEQKSSFGPFLNSTKSSQSNLIRI